MRLFWMVLLAVGLIAATPAAASPIEVSASRPMVIPVEMEEPHGSEVGSLFPQEVTMGAIIIGSAFAVGLVAGAGTLSTGLMAAGAVMIIYGLLP